LSTGTPSPAIARLDLGDDREAVTGRRSRVGRPVPALLDGEIPLFRNRHRSGLGPIVRLGSVYLAKEFYTTRDVFETNTFGVMAMTQAVVPQFRARRSGVVVNVTSSVTLTPMPHSNSSSSRAGQTG
jgi:short chain dehydrogenase